MATSKQSAAISPMRTLFSIGSIGNLTDGQLLERFATGRGEAAELAFAALVERHGPMVWRVCRSVLTEPHDAEDAFQATFLVLVKKARGLWVNDSLGAWLHQVAFRTASSALKDAIRRQRHERRAAEMAARESDRDEGARHEMEKLLHAEIDRLPERYRVPIVLCDLEGQSHEQAARHLGWPIGTVKSRLARGRDRLRDRLQSRGLFSGSDVVAIALRPLALDQSVPAALVQSTTFAAVRFGASQTIASATATALAQGVLNAMSMTRWVKLASVLLVAGATVSGAGLMSRMAASGVEQGSRKTVHPKQGVTVPVAKAERGTFKLTASGPGTLEAAQRSSLLCRVEGQTTIISIMPEGTRVKKGDLVCELDSAALRDQLTSQKIATQGEARSFHNAKLARQNAETALREYEEGTYPLEHAALQGEIKLAESAIQKAKAQQERTRRFRQRLNDTRSRKESTAGASDLLAELSLENQVDAAEQTLMHQQLTLEQAQGKLKLLQDYTNPRTIQELRSRIDERKLGELAKEQTYQLAVSKERKLEGQIESCKLFAPSQGTVVYPQDRFRSGGHPQIEEGATVRERQLILWIDDLEGPMLVNAKMPESMVDREQVGQKVLIKVDAFPKETFSGEVVDIAPLPDPTSFFNANVKVYTTHIRFAKVSSGLRPSMTANVEILLTEHNNAITVPTSAVIQIDGKERVAVQREDGTFDWRDVTVGDANESKFEIKEGMKPGERVASDPLKLLSDEERSRAAPALSSYIKKVMEGRPRGKTARKNASSPVAQKLRNLSAEDRAKFKTASPKEREAILKKAGFTDDELRQIEERRKQLRGPN